MDKENIEYKIQIIKDAFDEKRNIIGYAPNEMIKVNEDCHQGGDIFITDENELIDLEYQMKNFDEAELAKYVELAEELYEIPSDADFKIRLAQIQNGSKIERLKSKLKI